MRDPLKHFNKEDEKMIRRMDDFQNSLTHLRYEGRMHRRNNIQAVRAHAKDLHLNLQRHRRFQEKVIFPYLLTHLPKHETTIQFLRTDHQALLENETRIGLLLKQLSGGSFKSGPEPEVHEAGVSLICLLRHHIELEKRSIHKALQNELKQNEKREVKKRTQKWFRDHGGRNSEGKNKPGH